jgi:hypothetical protein
MTVPLAERIQKVLGARFVIAAEPLRRCGAALSVSVRQTPGDCVPAA